ncbi:sodium- and chloride-dependent GABA transporter 1-like [Actinia tenebrosa]|uniref:Transporter n=1 Tax=Actinia tenebrosa TaxID=6105 RepID=A0A6P8JAN4_ACTTE|nr:sodium- and chloride-dependent GABA transporter 1-like [Actinia tenebrosa]
MAGTSRDSYIYPRNVNSRTYLAEAIEKDPNNVKAEVKLEERENWSNKMDFILSCVGYAVGLGNVWRFPYLCYKNGGASFLIPYAICLFFCGIPIFFLEVALGQYTAQGVVKAWTVVSPLMGGIGFAMTIITFLCSVYYNVIMAWSFYYMFDSFRATVPWKDCSNAWNTEFCSITRKLNCTANCSAPLKLVSPEEEFFERKVLQLTEGIHKPGEVRFELAMCLLLSWIVVYFCVWKGIKSAGKVVYFTAIFPYVVLIILFFRGVTLEGAGKGVLFYLKPDFSLLTSPGVWVDAAGQIFFSLSVGFGGLITYGSYNKFHNNCQRDTLIVSLINCATSVFSGFVIFSMMGFMAHELGLEVKDVVKSGPGLAFIAYPEGIKKMPGSPFWAFIFFFMLFNLGLDSQFVGVETVTTVLADSYKGCRRYKSHITLIFCLVCYVIGLSNITQGGMYVFQMFDYQAGGISLVLVALLEVIGIGWCYGVDNFSRDIESMIGSKPNIFYLVCWKYISPFIILIIFIWNCVSWEGISYGDHQFPPWAEFMGWMLCVASLVFVPGFAIYKMYHYKGSFSQRFKQLLTPDNDYLRAIHKKYGISDITKLSN